MQGWYSKRFLRVSVLELPGRKCELICNKPKLLIPFSNAIAQTFSGVGDQRRRTLYAQKYQHLRETVEA